MPKSSFMMMGKKIGMVSSNIDSSSITAPSTTYSSKMPETTNRGAKFMDTTISASCAGTCVRANEAFITSAPMKIMKIMAALSAVAWKQCKNLSQVSSRFSKAAKKVDAAPTAAPSVGVKKPA